MRVEAYRPGFRLGVALIVYRLLWFVLLPGVLVYFWRRGRREPLYRAHLAERFGFGEAPAWGSSRPLWFHCASLGELRGAAPLMQALLAEGHALLFTTITPAGRSAAQKMFAGAIAENRLQVSYAPLELASAVRRFVARYRPRAALMCEIDTWPVLVTTLRAAGVPLAMANAQYPGKSLVRDQRWGGLRSRLFRAYQLVMCKSETHAARFRAAGCPRVEVVGETRFELPIPPAQLEAAAHCRTLWQLDRRPVLVIASSMTDEDALLVQASFELRERMLAKGLERPLVVHVPRSPQRFDRVVAMNEAAGLATVRRSVILDARLQPVDAGAGMDDVDVLVGDSLGEMHFFIALSQVAVVGSSFVDLGAHNIIEPLAQKKPVIVGASIWGIEYPGVEALAAGVLTQVADTAALVEHLVGFFADPAAQRLAADRAAAFFAEHGGSTARHLAVLRDWLPEA